MEAVLAIEDPVIYEYQELGAPEHPGDVAFGLSRGFPGKIGHEYYMTKGHFHNITDTAEVYYGLSGHGILLIENEAGEWKTLPLERASPAMFRKDMHTAVLIPEKNRWNSFTPFVQTPATTTAGLKPVVFHMP